MLVVKLIWSVIQVLIGYNLVLPLILYVLWLIVKKRKPTLPGTVNFQADYAIIVTAYEEVSGLPAVIQSISKLNYDNYLVYIVADNCDITGLDVSMFPKVVLLRPDTVLASNTASHFYAVRHFRRQHDRITIIDSDNLVHPDYLRQLNIFFDKGFVAVQGVRKAKNLNTTLACLDAARDIYYHFYDGKLLYECGSSATLAGSGMAFTVNCYRESLEHMNIKGAGFDKVLQYQIVARGNRIAYAENAIVYDEKTTGSQQLVNQRSRWINTWFKFSKYGFNLIKTGVRKRKVNQFLFGLILLRPPLFIFIGLSLIFTLFNVFLDTNSFVIWLLAFLCFLIGFAIPLFDKETDPRIRRSLPLIPRFMFLQFKALLYSRKANERSVATRHQNTGMDE